MPAKSGKAMTSSGVPSDHAGARLLKEMGKDGEAGETMTAGTVLARKIRSRVKIRIVIPNE
jgi:hypothetical protein